MLTRISFFSVFLVFGVTGCALTSHTLPLASAHVDRLYFGRSIGDSATVSDSSWNVFLQEVVTPGFPDGFSAWGSDGQWRNPNGIIVHEKSFILEIIHPIHATEADAAIKWIISEYKRRFHQESVLHVTTVGQASY